MSHLDTPLIAADFCGRTSTEWRLVTRGFHLPYSTWRKNSDEPDIVEPTDEKIYTGDKLVGTIW